MRRIIEMCFFLMMRRPPRSTLDRSSAASDVYKRQAEHLRIRPATFVINHQSGLDMATLSAAYPNGAVIIGTVSYTHLRAHETVLDLVCRLLLEKKQLKNT